MRVHAQSYGLPHSGTHAHENSPALKPHPSFTIFQGQLDVEVVETAAIDDPFLVSEQKRRQWNNARTSDEEEPFNIAQVYIKEAISAHQSSCKSSKGCFVCQYDPDRVDLWSQTHQ